MASSKKEVFLTREQVMLWGQFHSYTLNQLRKNDPTFPKPLNFGERQLRWSLDELEAWARSRKVENKFLGKEKEEEPDPNKAEWIYLPGRTKTCDGDKSSWIMKTGNRITVSVKGEISEAYRADLEKFCHAHGVEVPENGERVSSLPLQRTRLRSSISVKALALERLSQSFKTQKGFVLTDSLKANQRPSKKHSTSFFLKQGNLLLESSTKNNF